MSTYPEFPLTTNAFPEQIVTWVGDAKMSWGGEVEKRFSALSDSKYEVTLMINTTHDFTFIH